MHNIIKDIELFRTRIKSVQHSAKYIETEKPGHKIDVVSFVNHLAVQAEQTLEERMLKKNQAGGGQINPHDQERGPHIFADDGFVSALWFFIHIAVQGGFAAQCKRRKRIHHDIDPQHLRDRQRCAHADKWPN